MQVQAAKDSGPEATKARVTHGSDYSSYWVHFFLRFLSILGVAKEAISPAANQGSGAPFWLTGEMKTASLKVTSVEKKQCFPQLAGHPRLSSEQKQTMAVN